MAEGEPASSTCFECKFKCNFSEIEFPRIKCSFIYSFITSDKTQDPRERAFIRFVPDFSNTVGFQWSAAEFRGPPIELYGQFIFNVTKGTQHTFTVDPGNDYWSFKQALESWRVSAGFVLRGTNNNHTTNKTLLRQRFEKTSNFYNSNANCDVWQRRVKFVQQHSIPCQLEGSVVIDQVFSRQQAAFDFLSAASLRSSEEVRVFVYESMPTGQRKFIVCDWSAFWKKYSGASTSTTFSYDPSSCRNSVAQGRHVYEIIHEDSPCKLYFDLEYKFASNLNADGIGMIEKLIVLVIEKLYSEFKVAVSSRDFIDLDSSTDVKFSHHLILNTPMHLYFKNNRHAGQFVKELVRDSLLNDTMFKLQGDDNMTFVDEGVYTRNRAFRLLGSRKFGRKQELGVANKNRYNLVGGSGGAAAESLFSEKFLKDSLVCPFGIRTGMKISEENVKSRRRYGNELVRLLEYDALDSLANATRRIRKRLKGESSAISSSASSSSPYPILDEFILSIANKGGVQGEIRSWSLLELVDSDTVAAVDSDEKCLNFIITYNMQRNRWCENVKRMHKGNNIMYVVNLRQMTYVQKCHDQKCREIDYRSDTREIPSEIALRLSTE